MKQWQIEQIPGGLVLRVVPGEATVVPGTIVAAITGALIEAGALSTPIDVQLVDAVPRTPLGKAPLIKALRDQSAHA